MTFYRVTTEDGETLASYKSQSEAEEHITSYNRTATLNLNGEIAYPLHIEEHEGRDNRW